MVKFVQILVGIACLVLMLGAGLCSLLFAPTMFGPGGGGMGILLNVLGWLTAAGLFFAARFFLRPWFGKSKEP